MFNTVPLIPRAHLFGNPAKAGAQISPDGRHLAWLAPVEGVLNVWVGPAAAPQEARPVTDDRHRGIRSYCWAYDGRHLVYLQDENGNEDFHVHLVDPSAGVARNVTPFPGVRAMVMGVRRPSWPATRGPISAECGVPSPISSRWPIP